MCVCSPPPRDTRARRDLPVLPPIHQPAVSCPRDTRKIKERDKEARHKSTETRGHPRQGPAPRPTGTVASQAEGGRPATQPDSPGTADVRANRPGVATDFFCSYFTLRSKMWIKYSGSIVLDIFPFYPPLLNILSQNNPPERFSGRE